MSTAIAILALSIAYALATWPLVRRLESHLPRAAAVALVDGAVALALAAAAAAAAPAISAQIPAIGSAFPAAWASLSAALPAAVRDRLGEISAPEILATYSRESLQAVFAIARSLFALAGALIVIPVLAAYFQLDAVRYETALLRVVPARRQAAALRAVGEIGRAVVPAMRGQIAVSAIVGLLVYAALSAAGIPFAAAIALFTAVFDLVPYLGGIAAFVPSLLFALADGGAPKAALVGVLLLVIFEAEAQFFAPQIVGRSTKLPPSLVVCVLLFGAAAFGLLGLFLAVPVTAVIAAALRGWFGPRSSGALSIRSGGRENDAV